MVAGETKIIFQKVEPPPGVQQQQQPMAAVQSEVLPVQNIEEDAEAKVKGHPPSVQEGAEAKVRGHHQ